MFYFGICLCLAALLLAYVLGIQATTLGMGTSINGWEGAGSRGFQDAMTPPWSTKLSFLSYAASLFVLGYGWYTFGWLIGGGATVVFFLIVAVCQTLLLPKLGSSHYRNLVLQSMLNRYADYMKEGDYLRADAMGRLLEGVGVNRPK